jgi:hypothetical protein
MKEIINSVVAYLVLKKMKKRKGGCKFGRKERKKKERKKVEEEGK